MCSYCRCRAVPCTFSICFIHSLLFCCPLQTSAFPLHFPTSPSAITPYSILDVVFLQMLSGEVSKKLLIWDMFLCQLSMRWWDGFNENRCSDSTDLNREMQGIRVPMEVCTPLPRWFILAIQFYCPVDCLRSVLGNGKSPWATQCLLCSKCCSLYIECPIVGKGNCFALFSPMLFEQKSSQMSLGVCVL